MFILSGFVCCLVFGGFLFAYKIGKSEFSFFPKHTEMTGKPRCKILSEIGDLRRIKNKT